MSAEVIGLNQALGRVVRMRDRARDPRPALEEAAEIEGESIRRNFEAGGRPRWQPHAESTRRSAYGPSRLLIREGALMDSFKPFVTRRSAAQRSRTIYGPRQNYGYPGRPGRGHSRTPARRFALFQPEDVRQIGGVLLHHVTR